MARPLRIERPGAWYHVSARGNERRTVFEDVRDRQHFCELLAEATERFRWRVHAYVLMPNHYHLLVETPLPNLSSSMQWLGVSYTVWFNHRHERVGHLFQGRYKAILVELQAWGLALSRYLHLNPVRTACLGLGKRDRQQQRAGLAQAPSTEEVRRRLRRLQSFPDSSYRAYIGMAPTPGWLDPLPVLELIGHGSWEQKRRAYRQYVEEAVSEGLTETPWEHVRGQVVLGGAKFVKTIRKALRGNEQEQPSLRALRQRPTWERAVQAVEKTKQEEWKTFCDRHADWGRDMALYLGQRFCGLNLKTLAERAGGIDYRSAQKAIVRFKERVKGDKALAKHLRRALEQMSYDET